MAEVASSKWAIDLNNAVVGMTFSGLYLTYFVTVRNSLLMMDCDELSTGELVLGVEPSMRCGPGTQQAELLVYSWAGLGLVGLGVPCAFGYILYANAPKIMRDQQLREAGEGETQASNPNFAIRQRYRTLYQDFRAGRFYWRIVMILRKLVIAVVSIMYSDPMFQASTTTFALFVSYVLHAANTPFLTKKPLPSHLQGLVDATNVSETPSDAKSERDDASAARSRAEQRRRAQAARREATARVVEAMAVCAIRKHGSPSAALEAIEGSAAGAMTTGAGLGSQSFSGHGAASSFSKHERVLPATGSAEPDRLQRLALLTRGLESIGKPQDVLAVIRGIEGALERGGVRVRRQPHSRDPQDKVQRPPRFLCAVWNRNPTCQALPDCLCCFRRWRQPGHPGPAPAGSRGADLLEFAEAAVANPALSYIADFNDLESRLLICACMVLIICMVYSSAQFGRGTIIYLGLTVLTGVVLLASVTLFTTRVIFEIYRSVRFAMVFEKCRELEEVTAGIGIQMKDAVAQTETFAKVEGFFSRPKQGRTSDPCYAT